MMYQNEIQILSTPGVCSVLFILVYNHALVEQSSEQGVRIKRRYGRMDGLYSR